MEYWVWKADDDLILISDEGYLYKIDLIPPNPTFQHSNIPSFQYSTTFDYRKPLISNLVKKTKFSKLELINPQKEACIFQSGGLFFYALTMICLNGLRSLIFLSFFNLRRRI